MGFDEKSAERLRRVLAASSKEVVEKLMMGRLVFMVRGNMCCGLKDATLMLRVGPQASERLVGLPHARPAILGERRMAGFVNVDPEGHRTDAALAAWVAYALDFVSTLPAEVPGKRIAKKPPSRPKKKD